MKPLTLEWIEKAEGDLETAKRELRAKRKPNYDAVCFHAQQGSEKYLKAWLQEYTDMVIPRIHSLVELFNLCVEKEPSFVLAAEDLGELDTYAVAVRYPGNKATQEGAARALGIALSLQKYIRGRMVDIL